MYMVIHSVHHKYKMSLMYTVIHSVHRAGWMYNIEFYGDKHAQMYTGIHKQYYKGYTGIHRCSGICKRSMQVYTGIISYTQVYTGIHAPVYTSVCQGYTGNCRRVYRHTRGIRQYTPGIHRYKSVYTRGTQVYAGIHQYTT
jgi:hypothetical protein